MRNRRAFLPARRRIRKNVLQSQGRNTLCFQGSGAHIEAVRRMLRGHLGACATGYRRHGWASTTPSSEWEGTPERHTGGHREFVAGGQNSEQLFELRDVRSFGPRQANDARTGPKLVGVQRPPRRNLLCRGEPQRLDDHGGS